MRVLVCGGRNYADWDRVEHTLDQIKITQGVTEIIHGGAGGADQLAGKWARKHTIPVKVFRADWRKHGKAAGPIRNEAMLMGSLPDKVVAFPGGRGTADMVRRAKSWLVPVLEIDSSLQRD